IGAEGCEKPDCNGFSQRSKACVNHGRRRRRLLAHLAPEDRDRHVHSMSEHSTAAATTLLTIPGVPPADGGKYACRLLPIIVTSRGITPTRIGRNAAITLGEQNVSVQAFRA